MTFKFAIQESFILKFFLNLKIWKMAQLSVDCLNEIFGHLRDNKFILHSCLLTNRLWHGITV